MELVRVAVKRHMEEIPQSGHVEGESQEARPCISKSEVRYHGDILTEHEVKKLASCATVIRVPYGTKLTPSAEDVVRKSGIRLEYYGASGTNAQDAAGEVKGKSGQEAASVSIPCGAAKATLALGADHAGFELKELIKKHVAAKGYAVRDCGTFSTDSVDYPDFARAVALLVARGECRFGIIVDGAGIGSSIVANKVPGVRAALCYDEATARNSREHNDANVLTLGSRMISSEKAVCVVDTWLATPFGGGRHERRVEKIRAIEREFSSGGSALRE